MIDLLPDDLVEYAALGAIALFVIALAIFVALIINLESALRRQPSADVPPTWSGQAPGLAFAMAEDVDARMPAPRARSTILNLFQSKFMRALMGRVLLHRLLMMWLRALIMRVRMERHLSRLRRSAR
ncbi:MAG: hypothetical protein FJX63_02410 [Alphaproteobacteria bacterium]|nr:hypothetical protein [Alphaproteobacteria bacterium]